MLLLWRPADSGHVPTRCASCAERDSGARTVAILAVRRFPPGGLRNVRDKCTWLSNVDDRLDGQQRNAPNNLLFLLAI